MASGGVPVDAEASTSDSFFGGRLILRQPARGHRAGTDAVFLAAAVPAGFAGLLYDAGAGVGTAGLGVASRCPAARVGLIELDPLSARLAEANVRCNGLSDRATVHPNDLLAEADGLERADLVITNPPFYEPGTVRFPPGARRQMAHVGALDGTAGWISACLALLSAHGTLVIIHRSEALPAILRALDRRAGAVTILPLHTRPGAPAKRILVRALKGSRAPLALLPGFPLNDAAGFTAQAARIARGEAVLDW